MEIFPKPITSTNPYDGLYNGQLNMRGHHLDILRMVYDQAYDSGLYLPFEGFLDATPGWVIEYIKELVSKYGSSSKKDIDWPVEDTHGRRLPYGQDLCGFTERDAARYDLLFYQTILRYVTMPADQLIYLSKYPDAICRACHTAVHCDPKIPDNSEVRTLMDYLEYSQLFSLQFDYVAPQTFATNMRDIRTYIYWKNLHERLQPSIALAGLF